MYELSAHLKGWYKNPLGHVWMDSIQRIITLDSIFPLDFLIQWISCLGMILE